MLIRLIQNRFYLFAFYFFTSLLVFYPILNAHFVVDTNSFFLSYIKHGWAGLLTIFGDASMHIVQHYTIFFIWKFFGLNVWIWQVITMFFHAFCALQIYKLFCELSKEFEISIPTFLPFIVSLLFLIHPLTTETLAWSCCMMYIQVSIFCLWVIRTFLQYKNAPSNTLLVRLLAVYFVAVFTWELAFTLPLILLFVWYYLPTKQLRFQSLLLKVIFPMMTMVFLFFLLNKLTRNNFVGHYGAEAHLKTNPLLISFNMLRYTLKYMLIHQQLSDGFLQKLFWNIEDFSKIDPIALFTIVFAILMAILLVFFKQKKSNEMKLLSIVLLMVCISIIPVVNIWPVIPRDIQQDRYLYYTLCFVCMSIGFISFFLLKRYYYLVLMAYIFLGSYSLKHYLQSWKAVGEMAYGLVNDFRWYHKNKIYILSNADNVNGAFAFVNWPISAFAENLITYKGKDLRPRIYELAQLQHTGLYDSIAITKVDNKTIIVKATNGKFFYHESMIADSYETSDVKVSVNNTATAYIATFKTLQPNDVILFQSGKKWKEFTF